MHMGVSIPQAVSAVATMREKITMEYNGTVSIPQAVSAVATFFLVGWAIGSSIKMFQYRKR